MDKSVHLNEKISSKELKQRYENGRRFLSPAGTYTKNGKINYRWINGEDVLLYQLETEEGKRFMLMDAKTAKNREIHTINTFTGWI